MKLNKILCWSSLALAGLLALLFTLDLAVGLFFNRFSVVTDICVILASGLLVWQGVETLKEI